MVAKVAQPREVSMWLRRSWRIFIKKPLYLSGCFLIFATATILPSYISPFGRVFTGFLLPILAAGCFVLVFRIVRYKAISWYDLFFAFSESRLAVRLMPVCFFSLICWVSIGAVEYMHRQPIKYQLGAEVYHGTIAGATSLNLIFLLGIVPILIFSHLNFIQAIALVIRAIALNFKVVVMVWGGGVAAYYIGVKMIVPAIPVGAILMVFWYLAFDGLFMMSDDPLAAPTKHTDQEKVAMTDEVRVTDSSHYNRDDHDPFS